MKFLRKITVFTGFCSLLVSCGDTHTENSKEKYIDRNRTPLFEKVSSDKTGITFQNQLIDSPELNILNYLYFYNGAGVAAADFNNDGLSDLYFTANQGADKLYLNQGGFQFVDITERAGIHNEVGWTTGVTHVDINHDGLLDLYVCKVGNYKSLKGHNLLYINQGNDEEGYPRFKEDASGYGLDFSGFSTQAAFFDYDLDGDLDMYLLNHSLYPNRTYGKGTKRRQVDALSGDRFYRNNDSKFADISVQAGIFQGEIGYGLGVGVSDLNNDGFPDIYVGNDFFENDYVYLNQRDGTFKEVISEDATRLGHTTHFSMGNDLADIDNDGRIDIVSLDMLPENLKTYKTSGLEYPYPTYQNYLRNGYAPQFMQNTLHLNLGNATFAEIGNLAGMSATEWSWGALLADYDNDGYNDLFVSNGIKGATNDMDFINFIANDNIQSRIERGMTGEDMEFIKEMPEKKVPNYFFRNRGDLTFEDATETWYIKEASFSNGGTYADLDGDGDLDLIVSNVDGEASVLRNNSNRAKQAEQVKQTGQKVQIGQGRAGQVGQVGQVGQSNFLEVSFKGPEKNLFGIGTKVVAYTGEQIQVRENFTSRGYLSSVPPTLHFGLGKDSRIDSVRVFWPGGNQQTILSVEANRQLVLDFKASEEIQVPKESINKTSHKTTTAQTAGPNTERDLKNRSPKPSDYTRHSLVRSASPLRKEQDFLGFRHQDARTLEFDRDPLVPYASTNEGPEISVADVNQDGLQDIFISGAKGQASILFLQDANADFKSVQEILFEQDAINEDVSQVFFDADGDGDQDLLVVSGGNEFQDGKALWPRFYRNMDGTFTKDETRQFHIPINASKVKASDFDGDGDLDITIASDLVPRQFGSVPNQYLLENDGKGNFKEVTAQLAPDFQNVGSVKDFSWFDLDGNGHLDLIAVGHWMPVSVFLNDGKSLKLANIAAFDKTHGWWNSVDVADFDNDGDLDIVAGNWGLNSKFSASEESPVRLYRADFDDNGSIEPLVTYSYRGEETLFASKDELVKQLPYLNKKFLSYADFSTAPMNDLFSEEKLRNAEQKMVYELQSMYFENDGKGGFSGRPLSKIAQASSIHDITIEDFDNDGFKDLLIVGNTHEISTQLGRLDASHGLILQNDQKGGFKTAVRNLEVSGAARSIARLERDKKWFYIIGINDGVPVFLRENE